MINRLHYLRAQGTHSLITYVVALVEMAGIPTARKFRLEGLRVKVKVDF